MRQPLNPSRHERQHRNGRPTPILKPEHPDHHGRAGGRQFVQVGQVLRNERLLCLFQPVSFGSSGGNIAFG